MARIDFESEQEKADPSLIHQQIRQEVKKELFWSELQGKFKKLFRKIGCCFFLLVVLGGLAVIGLAWLNRTGWVKVPIIAEIFP